MRLRSTRRFTKLTVLFFTCVIVFHVYAWHDSALLRVDLIAKELSSGEISSAVARTDRLREPLTADFYLLLFSVGVLGLLAAVNLSNLRRDELFEDDEPKRPTKLEDEHVPSNAKHTSTEGMGS